MVGRRSPFGKTYFRVQTISFREGIKLWSRWEWIPLTIRWIFSGERLPESDFRSDSGLGWEIVGVLILLGIARDTIPKGISMFPRKIALPMYFMIIYTHHPSSAELQAGDMAKAMASALKSTSSVSKVQSARHESLNYQNFGDQTIQMYGNFEGFPL